MQGSNSPTMRSWSEPKSRVRPLTDWATQVPLNVPFLFKDAVQCTTLHLFVISLQSPLVCDSFSAFLKKKKSWHWQFWGNSNILEIFLRNNLRNISKNIPQFCFLYVFVMVRLGLWLLRILQKWSTLLSHHIRSRCYQHGISGDVNLDILR